MIGGLPQQVFYAVSLNVSFYLSGLENTIGAGLITVRLDAITIWTEFV